VKGDIEKRKQIGKRVRAVEKVDRDKWKMSMEENFDDEVELDRKSKEDGATEISQVA